MSGRALGSDPVRLAPVDLAAAFAPTPVGESEPPAAPDRAAGLRGLGLARKAPEPPPGLVAATGVEEPPAAVPAAESAADSAQEVGQDAEPERPDSPWVTTVVYVPLSVRDRLRAFHAASPETYTTIVLDAVEATAGELPALLDAGRPVPRDRALFSHRDRRRVRHEEAQVQVSLRPAREDLAVLDQLTVDCAAPSRSALVAAALDRYLPPLPALPPRR